VKRRVAAAGSLVSLLDVLFVLVFASLVQSHARGAAARAEAAPAEEPVSAPPAPVVPAPPMPLAEVRDAAAAAAAQQVAGAPLIVARIDEGGGLSELEWADGKRAIGVPLIERSVDPDVPPAYLGDRSAALQICGVVARERRAADLAGHVIVIAPVLAAKDRLVVLNEGLKRDVARCLREQQAMAVIVEPEAPKPEAVTP
jgi:hypothetical protein